MDVDVRDRAWRERRHRGLQRGRHGQSGHGEQRPGRRHGTAVTAPSVTTTAANSMLVGFFGMGGQRTMTPPAGMTERLEQALANPPGEKVTSEAADGLEPAVGASGPKTAIANSSRTQRRPTHRTAARPLVLYFPRPPWICAASLHRHRGCTACADTLSRGRASSLAAVSPGQSNETYTATPSDSTADIECGWRSRSVTTGAPRSSCRGCSATPRTDWRNPLPYPPSFISLSYLTPPPSSFFTHSPPPSPPPYHTIPPPLPSLVTCRCPLVSPNPSHSPLPPWPRPPSPLDPLRRGRRCYLLLLLIGPKASWLVTQSGYIVEPLTARLETSAPVEAER